MAHSRGLPGDEGLRLAEVNRMQVNANRYCHGLGFRTRSNANNVTAQQVCAPAPGVVGCRGMVMLGRMCDVCGIRAAPAALYGGQTQCETVKCRPPTRKPMLATIYFPARVLPARRAHARVHMHPPAAASSVHACASAAATTSLNSKWPLRLPPAAAAHSRQPAGSLASRLLPMKGLPRCACHRTRWNERQASERAEAYPAAEGPTMLCGAPRSRGTRRA